MPNPSRDDEVEGRVEPFFERLGVPEVSYAQVLEESIQHVIDGGRPAVPANEPRWYCIGPRNVGGRITALAQDPTNPLILYAGAAHGGLWKTIDAGDTWRPIGGRERQYPIGTIAIPTENPNLLYVGTGSLRAFFVGGGGLFRVSIAGETATYEPLTGIDDATVPPAHAGPGRSLRYARIALDPDDGTRFWAASQTGLWQVTVPFAPVPAAAGTVSITRDLPPPAGVALPANVPALNAGPAPPPSDFGGWPQYCTDVAVGRDPTSSEKVNGKARYLLVFACVESVGVFRGRFDRAAGAAGAIDPTSWTLMNIGSPPRPAAFGRVRVALCDSDPRVVYAVFEDSSNDFASPLARSADAGNSWSARGQVPAAVNGQGQASYDLVLEVNPNDPDVLLCNAVDEAKSENGADTSGGAVPFTQIADWQYYDVGDHSQHADNHAALFDRFDRRRVWVGNDGGLSTAHDLRSVRAPTPLTHWRKRSHGIIAGQFNTIAVNAALPFITGGGLQDNGSWVSFGGPTWYRAGWADGSGTGFHRGDPRHFFAAQNNWFNLTTVVPAANPPYVQSANSILVSDVVHEVTTPPGPASTAMELRIDTYTGSGRAAPYTGFPFMPVLAEDPTTIGQVLAGQTAGGGFDLASWLPPPPAGAWAAAPAAPPGAGLPAPINALSAGTLVNVPLNAEVSAIAFGPVIPAQPVEAWLGTRWGQLLVSRNAAAAPNVPPAGFHILGMPIPPNPGAVGAPLPAPTGAVNRVASIAVNPQDPRIVAVGTVPNAGALTLAIVTTGAPGALAVGNAAFQYLVKGHGWSPPASSLPTGPGAVTLPGLPLQITFNGAGPGAFVFGDQWVINSDLTVTPNVTNGSTGNVTVSLAGAMPVTVTVAPLPANRFSYQIAGGPVVGPQAMPAVGAAFPVPATHNRLFFDDGAGARGNWHAGDSWTVSWDGGVTAATGNAAPVAGDGRLRATGANPGRAFLTWDGGNTWSDVTGPPALPPPRPDLQSLPPAPIGGLAWDPTNGGQSLYAGTLVGVYQQTTVPVPTAIAIVAHPGGVGGFHVPKGDTRRLVANVTLSTGGPAVDWSAAVTWASDNPNITVNATGLVDATAAPVVAGNTANITARRGTVVSPAIVITIDPAGGGPPAFVPAVTPFAPPAMPVTWRPFGVEMPLALVNQLMVVPGSNRLRAATFGRGVWDVDLTTGPGAQPAVRLYIRQNIIEDGRTYPRSLPALLRDDPRLGPAVAGMDFGHAFDIRVDAPPYQFFDDRVDGVEFDERLGADTLVPLVRNNVYVQVHNSGHTGVDNVEVHLYFMAAGAALPDPPPVPAVAQPPLPGGLALRPPADFYRPAQNFDPVDPPVAGQWLRVGPAQTLARVAPDTPSVARFEWTVPASLAGGNVALLALCRHRVADDAWDPAPATIDALIVAERRTALRVVGVGALPPPALYIRDGIDDGGRRAGEVLSAGRSPDIIVVAAVPAQPAAEAFRDLLDVRPQTRLKGGTPNQIYVRVHNRGLVDTTADIELWAVPIGPGNLPAHLPAGWQPIQLAGPVPIQVPVPAGKPALAGPVPWTPPDPNPPDAYKAFLLVALIQSVGGVDALPAKARVTSLDDLWRLVLRFGDADNVAARALRWDPP